MRTVWISFDEMGRDCLRATVEAGANVVGVVTLPGPIRPEVSGQCAFEGIAAEIGARLIETANVNDEACVEAVRALAPDLVFVVGWSQLLREAILSVPRMATLGMHPTLLPRHRGRAPIPWAILSGLATTGVSLFEIADPTADSGAIVGQIEVAIDPHETAGTLYTKLASAQVELLRRLVPSILDGSAPRLQQRADRASWWHKRSPGDGIIDWHTRAPYLYAWVRAQTRPYPGAFTFTGERKLVVWSARPVPLAGQGEPAGTVVERRDDGVVVRCGEDGLLLTEVEAGDGPLAGTAIGELLATGERLG
jgi:methionyl-tRNA formyltransferase